MSEYKEIFKLKRMLEDAHIPFDWEESFGYSKHDLEELRRVAPDLLDHYHIMYPCKGNLQICSVIEGYGTFGATDDKLEIMGLLTPEERDDDCVLGYLTAENVFSRIQNHYNIFNRNHKKGGKGIIMKKIIKVVDEDTLEIKDILAEEDVTDSVDENIMNDFRAALNCEPEEFYQKYQEFKKAEAAFNAIYEPFKENLIKLHEKQPTLPKSAIVGNAKLTYISPSTRTSIDSKKLREEEPELAKKYTKTTSVKASIRLEEL